MSVFEAFGAQAVVVWTLVVHTWWLWLPPALFVFGKNLWKGYLKVRYYKSLEWVLLEIRIPRDIEKTPEAMEQVFAGLQALYWGFDPLETWWQGLQHDYLVFEMVSMGGETRFYVRLPVFFRNLVEAQIYAQYPETEIVEAEDYMRALPDAVPNAEWNMFGLEFSFEKPDPYPIRTYRDFLTLTAGDKEFEKVDPFASMAELLGRLRPGEHMGYHLLLRPAQTGGTDKWRKEGEALVDKLIGKRERPKKGPIARALEPLEPVTSGWGEALAPLLTGGEATSAAPKKEQSLPETLMLHLSPGVKDIVAAIERNIMKPGFEVIVRFCYVARRDVYSLSHVASFVGGLKTYNTQTGNGFKLNSATMATKANWWWPEFMKSWKSTHKKTLYYQYYRARKPFTDTYSLKSKFIVLNTEELATIYHYPGRTAKAPLMPRIEAKRSEPPSTLPVG